MATINFQLTITDLAACGRYTATHNRTVRNQLIRDKSAIAAICFAAVTGTVSLLGGHVQLDVMVMALVIAIVMYFLVGHALQKSYVHRFVQIACDGNRDFTRNMTVSFTDEGIEGDSDLGSGKIMWSSIQAVGENEKHVFLHLPGASYLIIPKSVFADQQAMTAFVTTIKSHIQK